jgi:uncharacterized protein YdeI (BOF family)
MTKSLLMIALAAATMGFAAPQATPAPKSDNAPAATQTTKKHAKKTHKNKKQSTSSNATASKPASK